MNSSRMCTSPDWTLAACLRTVHWIVSASSRPRREDVEMSLAERDGFMATVTDEYARDSQPFVLDYRRLNISARKVA